jgi:hypothetical protein
VDKEPDFEMVIQRHLTRAQKLRAIQQMIAEDPGIIPDLLEILPAQTSPKPPQTEAPVRRRVDAKTQAQKVVDFMSDNADDNRLYSVREIAEGTGLTRNTINALFYNSKQKHLFYPVKIKGTRRTLWRMREEDDEDDPGGEVDPEEIGLSESDFEEDEADEPEEQAE